MLLVNKKRRYVKIIGYFKSIPTGILHWILRKSNWLHCELVLHTLSLLIVMNDTYFYYYHQCHQYYRLKIV